MTPGVGVGVSQNQKPHLYQINTTSSAHSKKSAAVSNQSVRREKASTSLIPTVTFDLGNEWDDFDDENLVHASETSLASRPAYSKPQVQQNTADCNMTGRLKLSYI